MAPRKEARIKTSRWDDPDWTSLTIDAQWLYDVMLSQKSVTQAGILLIPRREWSNLVSDPDARDRITAARQILEDRRYIVVDDETDEVLIRTYIRHDVLDGPPGVFVGAMEAIGAIASTKIRQVMRAELLTLDRGRVEAKKAAYRGIVPSVALDRALALLGAPDPGPGGDREASEWRATTPSDASTMPRSTHAEHGSDMACDNDEAHAIGVGVGVGVGVTATAVGKDPTAAARERARTSDQPRTKDQPQVIAARLVGSVLPPTIGRGCRGQLARLCGDRIAAEVPVEVCRQALERWVNTSAISPNALDYMLDDAVKESLGATRARGRRTSDSVRGVLNLAERYAAEEAAENDKRTVIQLPMTGSN